MVGGPVVSLQKTDEVLLLQLILLSNGDYLWDRPLRALLTPRLRRVNRRPLEVKRQ